jgi:hypothetical protein
MQLTALVVEFLVPGILMLTAWLGILDVLFAGQIATWAFAGHLDAGGQILAGVILLTIAYVLGVLCSMEVYRVPWLKRQYRTAASRVYLANTDRLAQKAERLLGFRFQDYEARVGSDGAAERLFDEIWAYLRHEFREGIEEYKFGVALERLSRGYLAASPFLILMVGLEFWRLHDQGLVKSQGVAIGVAAGIIIVLLVLAVWSIRLLPFAVELEYYYLAVLFLSARDEKVDQREPTERESGDGGDERRGGAWELVAWLLGRPRGGR